MRVMGPPFLPDGESAYFLAINRNKKSIALDLSTGEARSRCSYDLVRAGRHRLGELPARHHGAPRVCVRQALTALNPRIIVCARSRPTGRTGRIATGRRSISRCRPWAARMSLTGEPRRAPGAHGAADGRSGRRACSAPSPSPAPSSGAQRTGRGASHRSLAASTARSRCSRTSRSTSGRTGGCRRQLGSGHASVVPYCGARPRSDGHLVVAIFAEKFWGGFCRAVEHPEWERDPRFASNRDRVRHRDVLMPLVEAAFRTRTRRTGSARLQHAQRAGDPDPGRRTACCPIRR